MRKHANIYYARAWASMVQKSKIVIKKQANLLTIINHKNVNPQKMSASILLGSNAQDPKRVDLKKGF